MTGKELIKLLQQQGWILDRIQGSHHILFGKIGHCRYRCMAAVT